jgi:hypothetical protein
MNVNKLLTTIALLLTISLVLILSESLQKNNELRARSFQQYVHGLGLGASVSPEWGFMSFDPRIDHADETCLWPIPGGYCYSPQRGVSVGEIKEFVMNIDTN